MSTVIAVVKAILALAAAASFLVFTIRRKSWSLKLGDGVTKSEQTGNTSDVENLFGGPPPQ